MFREKGVSKMDDETVEQDEDKQKKVGIDKTEPSEPIMDTSTALALPNVITNAEKVIGRSPEKLPDDSPSPSSDTADDHIEIPREALEARERIEVEDTFVPGKPFFTPEVVRDYLANPSFIDKFDTYLTMQLLVGISNIMENEDNLIRLPGKSTIFVGGILGDQGTLELILERFHNDSDIEQIVFLGNYVDVGPNSLNVINRLFLEKMACLDRNILLRGKHETLPVNYHHGFREEIEERFLLQHRSKVFNWYNEIFGLLPLAALHGGDTLALQGGIPRGLDSVEEINMIGANTELTEDDFLFELLWNEPVDEDIDFEPSESGERARSFGEKVFYGFMENNGLKRMIVSQKNPGGDSEYLFDDRLLRISSLTDGSEKNNGVISIMDPSGNISIETIDTDKKN